MQAYCPSGSELGSSIS
jgi:hypothetical protein